MQKVTLLNPRIAEDAVHAPLAPQLAALRNATVAFVDNSKVNADIFLSHIRPLLEQEYGAVLGKTVRKLAPKDELTEADLKELAGCDAVIQCFGDCGTSTSITVADGVRLERLGIPTVTVISAAFSRAAQLQAAGRGMGQLPIVEIPHPMHTAPKPVVTERAGAIISQLAAALTQRVTGTVTEAAPPLPAEIHVDSESASIQELFFAQGWSTFCSRFQQS